MKNTQNQLPDYLITFHTAFDNLREYLNENQLTLRTIDQHSRVYMDYVESLNQVIKIVMNSQKKGHADVSNYDMVKSIRDSGQYDFQVVAPATKDDIPYVIDDVFYTLWGKILHRDYDDMYYLSKNDATHCYNSICLTIRHELSDMLKPIKKTKNCISIDDDSCAQLPSKDLPAELKAEYLSRFLWQSRQLSGDNLLSIMAHTLSINTETLSKKAASLNKNKKALAFELAPKYLQACSDLGLQIDAKEYSAILEAATYSKATSAKSFEKERTDALQKREELNTQYSKMH